MKTKMFYAKSMSEGLKKISAEFGEDAIILSNRKVQGGIEIMAAIEEADEVIETYAFEKPESSDIIKNLAEGRAPTTKEQMAELLSAIGPLNKKSALSNTKPAVNYNKPAEARPQSPVSQTSIPAQSRDTGKLEAEMKMLRQKEQQVSKASRRQADELMRMQTEIHDLRQLLETQRFQLVENKVQEPVLNNSVSEDIISRIKMLLADKGFSADVIAMLVSDIEISGSFSNVWNQVLSRLTSNIESYQQDPIHKGGIYAFVGMTGSGKTTTLSKMAARFVMEYGAHDLLLITLDKFKVGSQDSLKSMSKILKCDYEVPTGTGSLDNILQNNQHKKLILIDTCGSFIGKEYLSRQLEIGQHVKKIRSLLVLPCTASLHALDRDIQANEQLQIAGSVLTKVDECPDAGSVISMAIKHQLPMVYWSNGQKIPEDLHRVNPGRLVRTMVSSTETETNNFMTEEMKLIANF